MLHLNYAYKFSSIKLVKMHQSVNPERQYEHQQKHKPGQDKLTKESVLNQIQQLKKVILNLQQRQISKSKKTNPTEKSLQKQKESQLEQLKLKTSRNANESRLLFGHKFYKDINTSFRARMVNKKHKANDQGLDNQYWQEGEQQTSIIHLTEEIQKTDSSNFVSERPESEQEECPGTQLFKPAQKSRAKVAYSKDFNKKEFQFKKVDYIPAIEEDSQKFYSYMTNHKEKKSEVIKERIRKQQKKQQSTASSNFQMINVASQPQFSKKLSRTGTQRPPSKERPEDVFRINFNKDGSKQELISFGDRIFGIFLPNFEANDKFTIKKYKNCIVFSLLPHITKAAIWYHNKQIFVGNISLNEGGKIERNGPGVEIVKDRHRYDGYYANSKKNGRGKIVYQNGDQYDGQWNQGQIYGFGRFKEGKTSKVSQGFWKNGQYCQSLSSSSTSEFSFP